MIPTAPQIACLMYHEVTDDPTSTGLQRHSARAYTVAPRAFVEQLARIEHAGRSPERIDRVNLAQPGQHLMLSFDDGGRSALDVGELLARRGWPAHFFVVTGSIGGRTFVDADGIRTLRQQGHVVGSHSHSHPDILPDLPREKILEEWRASRDALEQLLGERVTAASVPGGDLSGAVIATACEAGFQYLFTSEPWLAPRRSGSCWLLGRVCIKARYEPRTIDALVRFRGWRMARVERGLKWLARVGLAPVYRRYVGWSTRPSGVRKAPMAAVRVEKA